MLASGAKLEHRRQQSVESRPGQRGFGLLVRGRLAGAGDGAVGAAESAVARAWVDGEHREAGLDEARRNARVFGNVGG